MSVRAASIFAATAVAAAVAVTGCAEEAIDVIENQAPTAVLAVSTSVAAGAVVPLNGVGSSDADGSIESYAWNFGDLALSSGPGASTEHIWNAGGSFTVVLTVTDDDGADGEDSVVVVVDANAAPVAVIAAPATGSIGGNVRFDGAGSSDADGQVTSFTWDFGDGQTGTGPLFDHAFATAGAFVVTLTVTDDKGASNSALHDIVVSEAPVGLDGQWRWFLTDETLRDLGFLCGGSFQDSELTILANEPDITITEQAAGTSVAYSGTLAGNHFDVANSQLGITQSIIGDFSGTTSFVGIYRIVTGLDDCADRPVSGIKQ